MATGKNYVKYYDSLNKKTVDWVNDAIKMALFTSSLVIAQSADQFFDVAPYTTNEVAGTGYTAGGQAIASKTNVASTLKYVLSSANPSWTTATFTTAYGVLYDATPASNKPLIAYIDFGGSQTVTAGTFTITVDSTNGLSYVTIS